MRNSERSGSNWQPTEPGGRAAEQFVRPIILIVALVALVFVALGFDVRHDPLKNTDELKTAERGREMMLLGWSAVHDNFRVIFAKPPLQYWLTAATLSRWKDREMAVRVWPLLYGCLTTGALAWLAFLIEPRRTGLAVLSVVLLLSCPFFLSETSRALLDSGLTFFVTLALVFAQLARKKPAWWMAVALVCSLGALQKIPLIFLVWLLVVLVRLCSRDARATLLRPWLPFALVVAVIGCAAWPASQYWKFHPSWADLLGGREATVLTATNRLGARPYFEIVYQLCGSVWIFGVAALAAPIVVLSTHKKRALPAIELSIISLVVIAFAIVFNFRSARYVLPVLPCVILLLALVVVWIFESFPKARLAVGIALCVLIIGGIAQAQIQIVHRRENVADEKLIARELAAQQRPDTTLILLRAPVARGGLLDLFYLFYGDLRQRLTTYSIQQLRSAPPSPPLAGVCVKNDFPAVRQIYPGVAELGAHGNFVCWRAPAKSK